MKKTKHLLRINSGENHLHKSQLSSSLGRLAAIDNVHHSFMSSNDGHSPELPNNNAKNKYKYERVNNMFKLVEIKSNYEE